MGTFFVVEKVMRAALLLCALLAAPAGNAWMYPGCQKKCTTNIPRFCEGGQCKNCPFGSYINMPTDFPITKGYGGKEVCAPPPSCSAGTYFPVDKFGLYTGFNVTNTVTGAITTHQQTIDPCVKCGQTSTTSPTNTPGPTAKVDIPDDKQYNRVLYQPDSGAVAQKCQTCPDGKYVDYKSCKTSEGAYADKCSDSTAVTGPTRCTDCPDKYVTMQGNNQGCIKETECVVNDGKYDRSQNLGTGFMVDGKVCKPICPKNQWLQTLFCPEADSDGKNGKCDSSMCRDPAPGTRLQVVSNWSPATVSSTTLEARMFLNECDQKYHGQYDKSSIEKKDSECKSKVFDDSIAKKNCVGYRD